MPKILNRIFFVSAFLLFVLIFAAILGISLGSSQNNIKDIFQVFAGTREKDSMMSSIIWQIRFPRVILAAIAGAVLSLGGLVFIITLLTPKMV